MKTARDACQLQPNALSVKLSDQIEQLDELISAEGNGTAFFDRTFITQGMKDLITEGIARHASRPGRQRDLRHPAQAALLVPARQERDRGHRRRIRPQAGRGG